MENASKALIIAGAILLAIVIISLGLIVVNNTRGTVDSANMNEQEVQAYNAKFTPYEGSNISGTRVKTLCQAVRASDVANPESAIGNNIKFYNKSGDATPQAKGVDKVEKQIDSGKNYTVTLSYSTESSLITGVTIIPNN